MTVYASPDDADFFADYKRAKRPPDDRPTDVDHLDYNTREIFNLVDDIQRIVTSDTHLGPSEVGYLSGKLLILRIILNAKHRVRTPQIDRYRPRS